MAKQANSTPTPAPQAFPDVYAVIPRGDCMEPLYKDGVPLIISTAAKVEAGDVVIVHLKPGAQAPWGYEAIVKRLRYGLGGMTFPWDPTGSDVVIPLSLEQLNPPRTYNVPVDQIRAVHKVLGAGVKTKDGVVAPRAMVEAV